MCAIPADKQRKQQRMRTIDKNDESADDKTVIKSVACSQKMQISTSEVSEGLKRAQRQLRIGTIYGSLSLAMLVLSFSLTLPHMQGRRDTLGCDTMCLGGMTSLRSALSLFGSAMMGRWSDSTSTSYAMWGGARKFCLLVGAVASFGGLVVAGATNSIEGLWLSLIPGSLFQQNFDILKALFSNYHDDIKANGGTSDRSGSAGVLGMTVGLAFMLGPLAGATFVTTFEQAVGIALVCVVISALLIIQIPSSGTSTNINSSSSSKNENKFFNFLNVSAARSPAAIFLMAVRVCMALAFHIFSTIWTVSLKKRFDFGPKQHGQFMSFIGLTYALSQGVIAKSILGAVGVSNNKGRVSVLLVCCVLLGVGRYVAFQTESIVFVYCMFFGIVTSLGVVNTVLTADASGVAPSAEIGGLYGVLSAVESLSGMIGPVLGGALAYIDPIQAPLLSVVGLYVFVFCLVAWGYERFLLSNQTKQQTVKSS